jgi:hypothetical protein
VPRAATAGAAKARQTTIATSTTQKLKVTLGGKKR